MTIANFRFNGLINAMLILVCFGLFLINNSNNIVNAQESQSDQNNNGIVNTQTLTLLKRYADTLFLQCHHDSFISSYNYLTADRIIWLNEKDTFNLREESIIINLDNVISSASQLNFQLDTRLSQISCGYLSNGRYFRIKKWQIRYIEYPFINVRVRTRPESIYFKRVNESNAQISVPSLSTIYHSTRPLDIFKVNCETNFDYPIDKKYIWMYLRNPLSSGIESWYLDESIENTFQYFTKLNDTNQELPLSDFLKLILNDNTDLITFQCISNYELGNTDPFILTSSRNLSISKGDYYILDQSSSANTAKDFKIIAQLILQIILFILFDCYIF